MALRFFADHCVPMLAVHLLRNEEHEVLVLRDYLPKDASDGRVLDESLHQNAIALSVNGHFSDLTRFDPAAYHGIIAIQLHDHPEVLPALMRRLCSFLAEHPDQAYYRGRLFLVEPHRIRIRQ